MNNKTEMKSNVVSIKSYAVASVTANQICNLKLI